MSIVDEIRKLAELKRDGLIDSDEYKDLKRTILREETTNSNTEDQKAIEFYASAINGWLSYRQEANKQLLLLSSGALALLVSIVVPTHDTPSLESIKGFGLYFYLVTVCALMFFACLSSSLLELKFSPPYLKSLVTEEIDKCCEKILGALEKFSNWSFWLGALCLFALVFYKFF